MIENNFLFDKQFIKMVFSIAIPIAMQNIISFGVNAMDSVMLGKLGNIAVSGANLGGQPFFILMMIGFGLAGGGSVLISQYWGRGQKDVIRRVMRISMLAITIVSIIFTFVCFNYPMQILSLFTHEEDVMVAGASYLKVLSIGFVFYSLSANYMSSLRAVENVKMSTTVYAMSFFVNVFANYVFIFGKFGAPELGIVGAAVGTVIARTFEFICAFGYMYFVEKEIGYKAHCMFKIDTALFGDYINHALPVVGNELMWSLGATVTSMIMGRIGSTFVTANSITQVLAQLAQVSIFGISNAAGVVCGKTIGSGNLKRAQKAAQTLLVITFVFGIFSTLLILALRGPFLTIYDVTPDAKKSAYDMMFVLAMLQPVAALDVVNIVGILRGGGDTRLALILDGGGMWVVNIPLGILLGLFLHMPAHIIFLGMRSDSIMKSIIGCLRVKSGKWIKTVTRDNV